MRRASSSPQLGLWWPNRRLLNVARVHTTMLRSAHQLASTQDRFETGAVIGGKGKRRWIWAPSKTPNTPMRDSFQQREYQEGILGRHIQLMYVRMCVCTCAGRVAGLTTQFARESCNGNSFQVDGLAVSAPQLSHCDPKRGLLELAPSFSRLSRRCTLPSGS